MLQRDLDFKSIAIAETVSYFLGFALVGVVLAINGVGVWSIVIAQLVQAALLTGILVLAVPPSVAPAAREGIEGPRDLRRRYDGRPRLQLPGAERRQQRSRQPDEHRRPRRVQERIPARGRPGTDVGPGHGPRDLPGHLPVPEGSRAGRPRLSPGHRVGGDDHDSRRRSWWCWSRRKSSISCWAMDRSGTTWCCHSRSWPRGCSSGPATRSAIRSHVPWARCTAGPGGRGRTPSRWSSARPEPSTGSGWVAFGVTIAIFLNYMLMAQLSLQTAGIVVALRAASDAAAWGSASRRGPDVPVGLGRAASGSGQLPIWSSRRTLSAAVALRLAWLIDPDLTLGGDGEWLLNVIKSRTGDDETHRDADHRGITR